MFQTSQKKLILLRFPEIDEYKYKFGITNIFRRELAVYWRLRSILLKIEITILLRIR